MENYYTIKDYQEVIIKILKQAFMFKVVAVDAPDRDGNFDIRVSYDDITFRIIKLHTNSTETQIKERVQNELVDGGETYTLHSNTLAFGNILHRYGLIDAGYFFHRDELYKRNSERDTVERILSAADIKRASLNFENDSLESVTFVTNTHLYTIRYDGFEGGKLSAH